MGGLGSLLTENPVDINERRDITQKRQVSGSDKEGRRLGLSYSFMRTVKSLVYYDDVPG